MKPTTTLCAIFVSAFTLFAQEAPPLSLDKAAEIAQATLTNLQLPADNFLKSISLVHKVSETPSDYYIATFQPSTVRRIVKNSDVQPEPVKTKLIKVTFDGKASVVEQELPARRIIQGKKKAGEQGAAANP